MISRWLLFYPISIAMTLFAWVLAPILAMCVYKKPRTDIVKRYGKTTRTFDRYYLWKILNWFQTHDNACDEYFWGVYGDSDKVSITEYDNSALLRYWYRVVWLCRNPAYGFSHTALGFQRDDTTTETVTQWKQFEITTWKNSNKKQAFKVKGDLFISKHFYLSINFGWKAHKGFSRLMFADRLIQWPRRYDYQSAS